MSSDSISSVEALRLNDYVSLILITAVAYDYILTFSREIDYVWLKPWNSVSTMFILVRYVGLCWITIVGFFGSSFMPGPQKVSSILIVISTWGFLIFLIAADWVMILRVYAMWNRSRRIICILLSIYALEIIISFVLKGIYANPRTHLSVTVVQTLDIPSCSYSFKNVPPLLNLYTVLPRFILGATLLILVVIQTIKQSVEMYKATKQWQPNRYMQVLIRDGMLYFLVNVLFNIVQVLADGTHLGGYAILFLILFTNVAICVALPRFIIHMRELYDHISQDRWECGIDTGFGVLSHPSPGRHVAVSAVAFTDLRSSESRVTEEDKDVNELGDIRIEAFENDGLWV